MKVLVLGATGKCGGHALKGLLARGVTCTAIVRSEARLPVVENSSSDLLKVVEEPDFANFTKDQWCSYVNGCDAVVSCLGHNPSSLADLYREPRLLCTNTTRNICEAIEAVGPAPTLPVKYICVSTVLVDPPRELSKDPKRGLLERVVLWLLETFLPPHRDNEETISYLFNVASRNSAVRYCAVRPTLLKEGLAGAYATYGARQGSLFKTAGTTRANVGEFIAELVTAEDVWSQWDCAAPVIIDKV